MNMRGLSLEHTAPPQGAYCYTQHDRFSLRQVPQAIGTFERKSIWKQHSRSIYRLPLACCPIIRQSMTSWP